MHACIHATLNFVNIYPGNSTNNSSYNFDFVVRVDCSGTESHVQSCLYRNENYGFTNVYCHGTFKLVCMDMYI